MTDTVEKLEFQAEVREVLEIVIHSLYTRKEIFLRELISNASDALDKRRHEALTRPELMPEAEQAAIALEADQEKRTLAVRDNGLGMSREELIANLGTIAKSGTREFVRALQAARKDDAPGLIGRFGVGFYSAFMAADTVTVTTRRAGEERGWQWRSQGAGGYTIEPAADLPVGTTVVLSLKSAGEGEEDFTDPAVLRRIVKRYSDFITYPIRLAGEDAPLNSMKAIWTKAAKDIPAEEHAEFYRHVARDFGDPLESLRFSAEGASLRFDALLYFPAEPRNELFYPERAGGVHLFVNRVLVMEDCRELTPDWLRFLRGVVDSPDVSLNISRETVQQDRQIAAIRERIVRKAFDALARMKEMELEKYRRFWRGFGRILKEGLYKDDETRRRIAELMLFETSAQPEGELCSFADYAARMKPEVEAIYYLAGESRRALESSPYLEALKARGIEVAFFTDPVDEVVIDRIEKFADKPLRSAGKGEIGLPPDEKARAAKEKREQESRGLLEFLQRALSDRIREARFSDRLTESAVCLVSEEGGISPRLERMLRQSQLDAPRERRILELNGAHPAIARLEGMLAANADDPALAEYAELLYGQAALAEGAPLPDPAGYAKLVAKLMAR